MEYQTPPQQPHVPQAPIGMQPSLPNATTALVLGILSIPSCTCFGIVGLACGIIAVVLGSKAVKLYKTNPGIYSVSSYNNANAGKICGIIGLALSTVFFLYAIISMIFIGTLSTLMPWTNVQ